MSTSKELKLASDGIVRELAPLYHMTPTQFANTVMQICFPTGDQPSVEQFAVFLLTAKQYGLNPLVKEIYGIKQRNGPVIPVVAVDGWLKMINSHPTFDGMEFVDERDGAKQLISITCRMYRKDRNHAVEVTEYLDECRRVSSKNLPDEPWNKYPHRMLRHKAMVQAARYAFAISGVYEPDEAERIVEATQALEQQVVAPPPDDTIDGTFTETAPEPPTPSPAPSETSSGSPASPEEVEAANDDETVDPFVGLIAQLETNLLGAETASDVMEIVGAFARGKDLSRDQEAMVEACFDAAMERLKEGENPPAPPEEDDEPPPGETMKRLLRDAYRAGYAASKRVVPKAYQLTEEMADAYRAGFDDKAEERPSRHP